MAVKSTYYIEVAGTDVTGNFSRDATTISVTDSAGEASDTASITVDDTDGHIALPAIGAAIVIGLGWESPVIVFEGIVDDVTSAGSRGGGRQITISAKSADTVKGKTKEQGRRHKDNATLESVAKDWGGEAGLEVSVHADLASIQRTYWSMNNESFPAWADRIAKQVGATFKIYGTKAVFVPRSAGVSAKGQPLTPVMVRGGQGGNLISWSIKPMLGRPQHKEIRTVYFDAAKGEHKDVRTPASYDTEAGAIKTTRYLEEDEATSKSRSGSVEKETDRDRGGGSVEIDGDPLAQAEAPLILSDTRPGVDGTYTIESVTHNRSRGGGFTTSCTIKRPTGGAGKDDR